MKTCFLRWAHGAILMLFGLPLLANRAAAATVDFEDLTLPGANSFWNGPDPSGTNQPGPFSSTITVGSFTSGGIKFTNKYNVTFSTPANAIWSGFAYSNRTNVATGGVGALHDAFAGSGRGPSDNYGVGFGYLDLVANDVQSFDFDPSNPSHLFQLPTVEVPAGSDIQRIHVTNTTYTAISMRDGDAFGKKFGGPTGNDEDWYRLSVYGTDSNGVPLPNSVDFYLADFRDPNHALDYILADWAAVDLTPLSSAKFLHFNVASSDVGTPFGNFGMNTPGSFAIDDIELVAEAPEPATWVLCLVGMGVLAVAAVRRRGCRLGTVGTGAA